MIDPPDLSPGSSPWDTNRTNRTRSSGGKYESAHFLTPADHSIEQYYAYEQVRRRFKVRIVWVTSH